MKLTIASLVALAAMNLAALAGDLTPVTVSNGHGQSIVLYRSSPPTVALFTGNGATSTQAKSLKAVSKDNGHGQATILYRAE